MRRLLQFALLFIPWWMLVGVPSANASTTIFLKQQFSSVSGFTTDYYGSATRSVLALTTAITNSAASGTNIPQTKTAGGAAIAFISPPISGSGTTLTTASGFSFNAWAKEDAIQCNCTLRVLVQIQRTSCTVIDLLFTVELGTTIANVSKTGTQSACAWVDGDRLLITPKITNVGTMATGHSVTMDFAGPTNAADGDTSIQTPDNFTFQNEAEFVQGISTSGASATMPGISKAGNTIIVNQIINTNAGTSTAPTDDKSDAATSVSGPLAISSFTNFVWALQNIAGGSATVVTQHPTGGSAAFVQLSEYGGVAASSVDVSANAPGNGTAADSGPLVTTASNEAIVGTWIDDNSMTQGTGFVLRVGAFEDESVTSTGTYHATGTQSPTGLWAFTGIGLKWGTQPAASCVSRIKLLGVGCI